MWSQQTNKIRRLLRHTLNVNAMEDLNNFFAKGDFQNVRIQKAFEFVCCRANQIIIKIGMDFFEGFLGEKSINLFGDKYQGVLCVASDRSRSNLKFKFLVFRQKINHDRSIYVVAVSSIFQCLFMLLIIIVDDLISVNRFEFVVILFWSFQ